MTGVLAIKHEPADDLPFSVAGFAEACGVSRQRIYALIKRGFITVEETSSGFVIMPKEAERILARRTPIRVRRGEQQVRFDFSKI